MRTRSAWGCGLGLALSVLVVDPQLAVAQTPDAAPEPPAVDRARADAVVRYQVKVVAPADIAAAMASSVDLIRWQFFGEMTPGLFDRLVAQAPDQVAEAAATQGYFSARVDIALDRAVSPVLVTITVAPGPPTRISQVRIDVAGPANETAAGRATIARLYDDWLLPVGDEFRQRRWTAARDASVTGLAAHSYAAARLVQSEALVDPSTDTAVLSVALDSGPAFRFGRFELRGLNRYQPEMVNNFSALEPGALFSERALSDTVRRLLASGYFVSVQAGIDPDPAQADAATVNMALIEAPTRRVEAGVGYSTDTKYRVSGSFSSLDTFGRALQFHADARLETVAQDVNVRLVRPPNAAGWIDSVGLQLQQTDIENLETHTSSATLRRSGLDERSRPSFGIGFYSDEERPAGLPSDYSHALYVDAEYTWRQVDNLLAPTLGWAATAHVGLGVPGVSTERFTRLIGRSAAWVPLTSKYALSLRAEAGAVIADSRVGVPSVFLFRTGGDTTVRGYAFESLGVRIGNSVVGGRYYGVASAEVVRWMTPTWGVAAFVDAGGAVDHLPSFRAAVGYGLGARLHTPIGPFRFDLAYGHDVQTLRLHLSVGMSF
jgi:translocation and assembly module TamA